MTADKTWTLIPVLAAVAALSLSGCGEFGKVEQGRVIAYDRGRGMITLVGDSTGGKAAKPSYDALPPITVGIPSDPSEMGPAPEAGKLMAVDMKNRLITYFDASSRQFRTIPYVPVEERSNITRAPASSPVDLTKKTVTVYDPSQRLLVTFAATEDLLALPADTWKMGDEVRYYYKDPSRALRLMNVTKTDLNKSGG